MSKYVIKNGDGYFAKAELNLSSTKDKATRFETKQKANDEIILMSKILITAGEQPNLSVMEVDE